MLCALSEALKAGLPQIPPGGVLRLVRGYPRDGLIDLLNQHDQRFSSYRPRPERL
jgi:hypothetical protein